MLTSPSKRPAITSLRYQVKSLLRLRTFAYLEEAAIDVNSVQALKKVFGWTEDPILDRPDIFDFEFVEDVNERRVRDAESLAVVMRNAKPKIALEIGTSSGMATALMAANAPDAKIHTVNILPEDIRSGEGGVYTTLEVEKEKIGIAFKERGFKNIQQIFANTATWNPDIGTIDVAFIDGCHDTEFVINDTLKVLKHMQPGSFILWHDFNPSLVRRHPWIKSVCLGVEKLMRMGALRGPVFHLKDSWIGIYKV